MFYFFASLLWAKYNSFQVSDVKLIFAHLLVPQILIDYLNLNTIDKELNIRSMKPGFMDFTF